MLEYSDFLRVLSSLVIVIVLIYSIYYIINRYGKGILPGQKGLIQIKEIRYIGKNKGLAVVRANSKYYFLSFDDKNLSIIEKWDRLEEEGDIKAENESISDGN
ncbi:Flagellar biogenesis protein FliO [Persephonella hydrogeniphila]|uniref:Flagellar biogenesis protein FliO n=1 Tax=Persephonella hydrogeniphila TaxID=198703 RepID=A0A285NFN6_9AQUI|nr:flagellar biosynthetic protein FliO [Persephonella hydrogeniphila]SNZ08088.1 Flagellar biogenesis protein FliO [Persephonella hydrogeniphila]